MNFNQYGPRSLLSPPLFSEVFVLWLSWIHRDASIGFVWQFHRHRWGGGDCVGCPVPCSPSEASQLSPIHLSNKLKRIVKMIITRVLIHIYQHEPAREAVSIKQARQLTP